MLSCLPLPNRFQRATVSLGIPRPSSLWPLRPAAPGGCRGIPKPENNLVTPASSRSAPGCHWETSLPDTQNTVNGSSQCRASAALFWMPRGCPSPTNLQRSLILATCIHDLILLVSVYSLRHILTSTLKAFQLPSLCNLHIHIYNVHIYTYRYILFFYILFFIVSFLLLLYRFFYI